MAVLKPRNRLVYFRVSEEEFQLFSGMCELEGARSISDLARLALQRLAQEHRLNTEDDFIGKLKAINEVLNELGEKVERLKTQLESTDGSDGKTMVLTPVP
jgi:dynactin complex subunit